jgi:F-type H+-transporting ATPase subunit delta
VARPSTTARRYAEAIFELAERDATEDVWAAALDASVTGLGAEEVARVVENPAVPFEDRRRAVTALTDRIGGPVATQLGNLVTMLLARRRVGLLVPIAAEYRRQLDGQRGVVAATVISAAPLDEASLVAVRQRVTDMTGATVRLAARVDPDLIGGLTLQVGDRLLDASLRGRLERLRVQLARGAAR